MCQVSSGGYGSLLFLLLLLQLVLFLMPLELVGQP
jgi:hypothetical protein